MRTKNPYDQFDVKNNGVNAPQSPQYDSFELKPDRYDYADRFEYNDDTMNTKDFMTGVVFGAVVGAAAALMMAPKSGRELRDNLNLQAGSLKERAGGLTDKTSVISNTVQEKSSALMDKVKSMTSSGDSEKMEDKTEDVKSAVDSVAETVKEKVDNTADTAKSKLDETKKAFDEAEKSTGSSSNGSSHSSKPKSEGWTEPADKGINEKKQNGGLNTNANNPTANKTGFSSNPAGSNSSQNNNSGFKNNSNNNNNKYKK